MFTNSNFKGLRSYKNLSTSLELLTTNHNKGRLKSMKNAELVVTETVLHAARCSIRRPIIVDWLAESGSHFLGHTIGIMWPINNVYTTVT